MKNISIKTGLLGRQETFKILAVGHVTGYPVLLEGPPGVGKTRALLDYSMALNGGSATKALEDTFILETDEGTRPAEIKGRVNMEKLLAPGFDAKGVALAPIYELDSPISRAKMILINEIDKANPGLRNSMLGVMNEKMLFNGKDKVYCPWELFCSAVNSIPKEEAGNPFWDRFVLKHKVSRLQKNQLLQYYKTGGAKTDVDINLPESHEIDEFITKNLAGSDTLRLFVEATYQDLSDRSLSYAPRIIAAVSYVYDMTVKKAIIKTCEILTSAEKAKSLAAKLEPAEISAIRNKIDYIKSLQNYDQILAHIEEIKEAAKKAAKHADVSKADMEEIAQDLNKTLQAHPVYSASAEKMRESMESNKTAVEWTK